VLFDVIGYWNWYLLGDGHSFHVVMVVIVMSAIALQMVSIAPSKVVQSSLLLFLISFHFLLLLSQSQASQHGHT
jgi:hypothetical protein